jgi:sulfate adenylyltransferase subunit 1
MIKEVVYKIDINSLGRNAEDKELKMNDISKVKIRTTKPLMVDSYRKNRTTGSIILVDEATNETVAAGMIV